MYVVTGGAGFIGSNLVAALSERGHEVVVVDWLRHDARWRNLAKHEIRDLIAPDALREWLPRHERAIDTVIFFFNDTATTESDVDLLFRQNSRATFDLLDWCTHSGKRLIYASSAATYGDGSRGFDDDASCEALAQLRPLNAYGWSKHVVDQRIARVRLQGGALPPQCVGLKFFNVYGPNEYHKGSMQSVVARNFPPVQRGEPVRLFRSGRADYTDGGQQRDFVYVADCVAVLLWLLETPQVSGLFNVGSGRARSWLDLATALFSAAPRPARVEFIDLPAELRDKYQYFTEASMTRLRAAGYSGDFTSMEAGVADYVRNFLARPDPYR